MEGVYHMLVFWGGGLMRRVEEDADGGVSCHRMRVPMQKVEVVTRSSADLPQQTHLCACRCTLSQLKNRWDRLKPNSFHIVWAAEGEPCGDPWKPRTKRRSAGTWTGGLLPEPGRFLSSSPAYCTIYSHLITADLPWHRLPEVNYRILFLIPHLHNRK